MHDHDVSAAGVLALPRNTSAQDGSELWSRQASARKAKECSNRFCCTVCRLESHLSMATRCSHPRPSRARRFVIAECRSPQ